MKSTAVKKSESTHTSNTLLIQRKGQNSFFGRNKHGGESFIGRNSKSNPFLQPKLNIGKPNDVCEQEADRVADRVMSKPDPIVQRQEDKEDEVQAKLQLDTITPFIQKKEELIQQKRAFESPGFNESTEQIDTEETPIQEKSDVATGNNSNTETKLQQSRGGGESLPEATQSKMESGIGADFSGVKIHTGTVAVQMSSELNAQAFTSGNDIYFNEGKYNPGSTQGDHLLAHELTHTVQQGANIRTKRNYYTTNGITIQRGLFDSIGDWVGDIKSKIAGFVQSIPGYFLFTVLLGQDPLTDKVVERNGQNIIKGFLSLLPFGLQKYQKLEQEGALKRSASWIDQQIEVLNSIRLLVSGAFKQAVDSLSISDVARPGAALERIKNYFTPVISKARNFAFKVAKQVLQFLKEAILNSLVKFIKEKTRAYPLLRILLGRDPITSEKVPRTMKNIVHGFEKTSHEIFI